MNTNIARLFSLLFNPFIITTYYLLIVFSQPFYFSAPIAEKAKWMVLGLVFITTFLLPLSLTWIFGKLAVKTMKFDQADERNMQLSIASVFYLMCYFLLNSVNFSPVFNLFVLGFSVLIILVLIVNFYWKISAYMVACGALAGALTGINISSGIDLLPQIISVLLISGITGYSRLKQQTHNPEQVYTGFGVGSLAMTAIFIYF